MSNVANFVPASFFVLRTPLLPFDRFQAWSAAVGATSAAPEHLEHALRADRTQLRAFLQAQLAQPAICEAIFVASPDLAAGLARWYENPDSEKGLRAERALVRYFARMTGRATPFGLFAGYSVGTVNSGHSSSASLRSPGSNLTLGPQSTYQRHTRLDMDYLFALTERLNRDPAIQCHLYYRPNSSLYRTAGRLRYAEARLDGKVRTYHLVAVEENEYLLATLDRAQNGATPGELAAAISATDPEIALAEAEAYIAELIASQLLVPELAPTVTGREPIHELIDILNREPATQAIAQPLIKVRTALAHLDEDGLGNAADCYQAIAERLRSLPAPVELARLFQVDMIKPTPNATLGSAVISELMRGVALLQRITPPQPDPLQQFRERFVQRYESREVPLMEVLDEESGIGFRVGDSAEHAPLLNGLNFPATPGETTTAWGARQAWLLRKLAVVWRQGDPSLVLTDRDLAVLANSDLRPLPASFAVMATVAAASQAALARGEFQLYLENAGGPSGARLLGRFCHGDPRLHQAVEQYLAAEAMHEPDAVFAEIVHLPEGRIGNVLCRPVLRQYEIPYLGQSGAAVAHQIPVTDLMVSVVNGQIVLRSQQLGRRVIPRLTTAHNFSLRSQGVYQFLCSLQHQQVVAGLRWDWGALGDADFLPRVTCGRLVLARARWNIGKEELQQLGKLRGAELWRGIQSWRTERRLPRLIVLVDNDNELPVDLDNLLSIESFIDVVKNREMVQLNEFFPGPAELCAEGPEGSFVHELIVPFTQLCEETDAEQFTRSALIEQRLETRRSLVTPHKCLLSAPFIRRFPPGSAWLYAKLYTGTATADQVLNEVVAPVVRRTIEGGAADRWFFIRYGDPDWHLRLRIHGDPQRLHDEVLPLLQAASVPLLADGRVWRLQLDTYEREVERYGGIHGIELAERLFHADSEAVLQIVEQLEGDVGADARWRLTLRGMDLLLDNLGFALATKQAVIHHLAQGFLQEFHAHGQLRSQLGEKQRNERQNLTELFLPKPAPEHPLEPGFLCLRQRTAQLGPIIAELKTAEQAGCLAKPLTALAGSYLHMYANRLLRSAHRAQEMVLYDLLDRHYTSQLARQRALG